MADHHTVIDYFLTADGWRYQAVCDCRWSATWPSTTRNHAARVGRGHEVAERVMDDATCQHRETT